MESHFLLPLAKYDELNKELKEIKEAIKNPPAVFLEWISEKETQHLLGLKATSLWALRKKKSIRYSKIGGKTFYNLPSIEKYLDKNEK